MALDYALYVDPAGTDDGQPVISVGGALSTGREWTRLTRDWLAVLRNAGITYLHMAEFASGFGEFRKSKEDKEEKSKEQNTLIWRLAEIIAARVEFIFAVTVRADDFEDVVGPMYAKMPSGARCHLQGADAFCVHACLETIMGVLPRDLDEEEQVSITFDRDTPARMADYMIIIEMAREVLRQGAVDRFGDLAFGNKKLKIPLQVADLIAHQAYRERKTGIATNLFAWITEHVPHRILSCTKQDLERIVKGETTP